jgi:signal transduction histidine kinase
VSNQPSTDTGGRGASLVPGLLAVLAALVVLGNGGAPLDGGSGTSRALGVVLPPLALGLAAAALCLPARSAAGLALLGGALAGVGRGVVYDPLRDRPCVRCLSSSFATHPDAHLADVTALVGGLLIVTALILAVVRHRRVWSAIGVVIVGYSTTAYDTPHGVQVGAVRALVVVAALSLATAVVHLALARRAMTRLAEALSSGRPPDDVLKSHLRDPGAWVEFAAPSPDGPLQWVTENGSPASARTTRDGESTTGHTTMVSSRGRPVARIHHSRPLATIGAELILRLEQAGLEAGLAAQVHELASSRTRIVERADAERRQLERDLHDGAQQYLLALAVDLSLAAADPVHGGAQAVEVLLDCRRDAEAALEELRRIARGVYPVLLASGGLAPALQELGRRVGTRITVDGPTVGDVSPAAAAALYGLVEELATSKSAAVSVSVCGTTPQVVDITGGSVHPDSLNLERIAASGGNVERMSGRIVVTFS